MVSSGTNAVKYWLQLLRQYSLIFANFLQPIFHGSNFFLSTRQAELAVTFTVSDMASVPLFKVICFLVSNLLICPTMPTYNVMAYKRPVLQLLPQCTVYSFIEIYNGSMLKPRTNMLKWSSLPTLVYTSENNC